MRPPDIKIRINEIVAIRPGYKKKQTDLLCAITAARGRDWSAISATAATTAHADLQWKCEERETKG
jgi:hypothetical protein